jgi:amino acid transporter
MSICRATSPTQNSNRSAFMNNAGYGGAIALNYIGNAFEHAGELLNFGAFLAFMGVNLSVFWQFTVLRRKERRPRIVVDMILPLLGFGFCALIWWNLNPLAKVVGGIWFLIGFVYLGLSTHGFCRGPKMIDFTES